MTSMTFFLIFIPILSTILLLVNFILAPHKPNKDKDAQFECGFSSFTQMSRMPFSISFFIYALLFLLFDLEILLVYPYVVSSYNNSIYGLIVMLVFFILLTIGFVFELGKKALQIDSRQTFTTHNRKVVSLPKLYLRYVMPNLFLCSYINYPFIINFVFYIVVWISIQVYFGGVYYCDSSPDSISSFAGKTVEVESGPSNTRVTHVESGPSNSNARTTHVESGPSNSNNNTTQVESAPSKDFSSTTKAENTSSRRDSGDDTNTNENTADNRKGKGKSTILPMPFIMESNGSNEDNWHNTYDNNDRRRYWAAIDELNINTINWKYDGEAKNIEKIEKLERLVESMKAAKTQYPKLDEAFNLMDKLEKPIEDSLQKQESKQVSSTEPVGENLDKKRKMELEDEAVAKRLQQSLYQTESEYDSDSDSVLSSMRGDESPRTYEKKLKVLQEEFNLEKRK